MGGVGKIEKYSCKRKLGAQRATHKKHEILPSRQIAAQQIGAKNNSCH